jgi:hypothetical protein
VLKPRVVQVFDEINGSQKEQVDLVDDEEV